MSKTSVYIFCGAGLLSAAGERVVLTVAFLAVALCFSVLCVADAIRSKT